MWICCSFAMSGLRVPRNQRQLYFLIPGQFEGKIGSISFWRWGTNLLIMPAITEFLEIQVKHAMQKAPLNNKLSRFDRHDLGGYV
uniref:Uncharacterized protein n=1 Tax=Oryza punctata TaxID=4537 RepID=A0A0E0JZ89_ORYPU